MISQTKTKVIMDREVFWELKARIAQGEQLTRDLRARLEASHDLLIIALHDLAAEQGARDFQYFARRWLRKNRIGGRRTPTNATDDNG